MHSISCCPVKSGSCEEVEQARDMVL
jgi:hypothetical protein